MNLASPRIHSHYDSVYIYPLLDNILKWVLCTKKLDMTLKKKRKKAYIEQIKSDLEDKCAFCNCKLKDKFIFGSAGSTMLLCPDCYEKLIDNESMKEVENADI